jgi:subtilisin family serine protease
MKYKQLTATLAVGVVGGMFAVAGGVAGQTGSLELAETQAVLVETPGSAPREARRVAGTNLYLTTVSQARAYAKQSNATFHAVQNYTQLATTNDPLEPQSYLTLLNAQTLWDTTTGTSSSVVAVIDSGFALEHEDLSGRWYVNDGENGSTISEGPAPNCTSRSLTLNKNCNNLDDDTNGFKDDWRGWDFAQNDNDPSAGSTNPSGGAVGHGTATTGFVGATGNNSKGVASLNWGVRLMPLQIFTDSGTATTVEVAEAVAYAIDMGADVINLSLGSLSMDTALEELLVEASGAGIMVVAAAGNCGGADYEAQGCDFQGQALYPATSSTTIGVAATDLSDVRAPFSSQGSTLDLAAPGAGALKTTLYSSGNPLGAYSGSINGTSFATPIVSGAAALVRDAWPTASTKSLRAVLVDSALKVGDMGGQTFTETLGFGRLRPVTAVNLATACAARDLPADINCDGTVGILDLSFLASQWQLQNAGRTDINQSATTDILDLSALASKWGQ